MSSLLLSGQFGAVDDPAVKLLYLMGHTWLCVDPNVCVLLLLLACWAASWLNSSQRQKVGRFQKSIRSLLELSMVERSFLITQFLIIRGSPSWGGGDCYWCVFLQLVVRAFPLPSFLQSFQYSNSISTSSLCDWTWWKIKTHTHTHILSPLPNLFL